MAARSNAVRPTPRHVERRAGRGGGRRAVLSACALITVCSLPLASCKTTTASTPVAVTPPPPVVVPAIPWQQKIGWIVRLEDQRLLRDPNPPPPAVIREATATAPAVLAPLPPSDLVRLLEDRDARVRARAALAVGRVGLSEGIAALTRSLSDPDVQVRQASAFAMGLIGDAEARPALLQALTDASPIVQGRAAEALGLIGDRGDAQAVAALVQRLVKDGALAARGARRSHVSAGAADRSRAARYLRADTSGLVRSAGVSRARREWPADLTLVARGLRAAAYRRQPGQRCTADAVAHARPIHGGVRSQGAGADAVGGGGDGVAADRRASSGPGGRRHSGHAFAGSIGQCGRHAGAPSHRWRCHRRQCAARRGDDRVRYACRPRTGERAARPADAPYAGDTRRSRASARTNRRRRVSVDPGVARSGRGLDGADGLRAGAGRHSRSPRRAAAARHAERRGCACACRPCSRRWRPPTPPAWIAWRSNG